jgi:hypothetical protein
MRLKNPFLQPLTFNFQPATMLRFDQNFYHLRKNFSELRCDMKTRRWLRSAAGILFCGSLFITITGCVAYGNGRSGGAGVVVVAPLPPDEVVFAGDYDSGRDVHEYSQRGYQSREAYDRDHDNHHEPVKDKDHEKDHDNGHKD